METVRKSFKIGELAYELNIKAFVIRFWEKEFKLKPSRTEGGQRFYTNQDFLKFKLIKELLYEKKFTLEGARKELKKNLNYDEKMIVPSQKTTIDQTIIKHPNLNEELKQNIKQLRNQLIKLKELL